MLAVLCLRPVNKKFCALLRISRDENNLFIYMFMAFKLGGGRIKLRPLGGISLVGLENTLTSIPILSLFSSAIAFLVCLLLTPRYIRRAHEVGMVGPDIHKPTTPMVAECGGIILMLAYVIGLFILVPFVGRELDNKIVGTAATVLLSSFVGLVDDIYELKWRTKVLTPLLGGVPLAVMQLGRATLSTPFGVINFKDFGLPGLVLFYGLILPFIVTACANAVNMFAGLRAPR